MHEIRLDEENFLKAVDMFEEKYLAYCCVPYDPIIHSGYGILITLDAAVELTKRNIEFVNYATNGKILEFKSDVK